MLRFLLFLVLLAPIGHPASAVTIHFETSPLATEGSTPRFEYRYRLSDFSHAAGFGFSILFDPDMYASLGSPPPVGGDWDVIAIQPDPHLPDAGLYDALALVDSPETLSGFRVEFLWLGPGVPGSQPFVVYDESFRTVESAHTLPVPEPRGVLLVALGLAVLAITKTR